MLNDVFYQWCQTVYPQQHYTFFELLNLAFYRIQHLQLALSHKPWVDLHTDEVLSILVDSLGIDTKDISRIHIQRIPTLVRAYYERLYGSQEKSDDPVFINSTKSYRE